MKQLKYLLISFGLLLSLGACDKLLGGDVEEDPAISETMVGLWYDVQNKTQVYFIYLREDRVMVSAYAEAMFGEVTTGSAVSSWMFTSDGQICIDESPLDGMYCEAGALYKKNYSSLEYEEMSRVYDPRKKVGPKVQNLTRRAWTGYVDNKIVTLKFDTDGTVTRTYKPNAGWEGEEEVLTCNYSTKDGVIYFEGLDEARAVTIKGNFSYNFLFADFGDVIVLMSDRPE